MVKSVIARARSLATGARTAPMVKPVEAGLMCSSADPPASSNRSPDSGTHSSIETPAGQRQPSARVAGRTVRGYVTTYLFSRFSTMDYIRQLGPVVLDHRFRRMTEA